MKIWFLIFWISICSSICWQPMTFPRKVYLALKVKVWPSNTIFVNLIVKKVDKFFKVMIQLRRQDFFWHDRIWTPTLEFHLSKELQKLLLRPDRDAPRVRIFQKKWSRCFCWCKGTNVQFKEKLSARSNIAVFCFSNLFLAFDKRIETYKAVQMCVLQY